jgi:hypothetical protein
MQGEWTTQSASSRPAAKETAKTVASDAAEKATDVAHAAGDHVRDVADEMRTQTRDFLEESRERLRSEAAEQTRRIGAALRELGDQLQAMASGRPTEGPLPEVAARLADTVTRVADRMQNGGSSMAMTDVKRFAQRRPGTFLAGALGAGVVVGRVLRAADTKALAHAARESSSDGRSREPSTIAGDEYLVATGAFREPMVTVAPSPATLDLTSGA